MLGELCFVRALEYMVIIICMIAGAYFNGRLMGAFCNGMGGNVQAWVVRTRNDDEVQILSAEIVCS